MFRKVMGCLLLMAFLATLAACGPDTSGPTPTPVAKRIEEIGGKQWTQVQTDSPLKVLSAKLFFTGLGETAFVIGELENTSATPVTKVKISFKGYAKEGKLLDTREGEAPVAFIDAKGKAPFKIAVDLRDVSKFELIVNSTAADKMPDNTLKVLKSEMSEPKTGYVWVTGQVKNEGTAAVPSVEIITVLRDSAGAIVEVGSEKLTNPLDAGQTADFKFMVMHRDGVKLEVSAQPAR